MTENRKSKENKPVLAICYDFDKTLSPDDMQAQGYIQEVYDGDVSAFWKESNDMAEANEMDTNLSYMYKMVQEAAGRIVFTRKALEAYGAKVRLFNGVEEWFEMIRKYGSEHGVIVEHYIISSGLKEMIEGTSVAKAGAFEKIYASSFLYNERGVAVWPSQVINYTNKTQFLFRIEKGVLDINDFGVNDYFDPEDIRVPFRNIVYIGDSDTDIPCMKLVNTYGGHSIGVYNNDTLDKTKVYKMLHDNRIKFFAPADYTEGSELDGMVKAIINRTSSNEILESLHYDCKKEEIKYSLSTSADIHKKERVDAIVRSFKEYDVYWLSGYVKAFQLHGDGEPLLFFYEGSDTRGINVVMKRDVAKDERFKEKIEEGQYFDFATPYGYGGWIIEGKNTEDLFQTYERWLKKNGIISEFVRFHPMVKNHDASRSFYEVIQLGEVVHMDLSSPEDIWNNIISKNRNMIRKAIKNGIVIYNGRFPDIFEKFRTIYNVTMDKDDAEEYYYFGPEFYQSVLEDLPQNSQVFWAEKEEQVIAASIMLATNGRMNYHLSGSLREFSSLAPTNLLLYEAALWGCANGYKTLYLGGGVGSGEDSLFKFKRAFYKGTLNHFYIGKRVYDQARYDELLRERSDIGNSGNFPKYRG